MKSNKKGFTLVELLVVIAIVGVLAGLIMGAVAATRSKATATQCKSYLKQIATACIVYSQDMGAFPDVTTMAGLEAVIVPDYSDSTEIFSCADKTAGTATYDYNRGLFSTGVMRSADNIRSSISVLVYDNEARHSGRLNACFADGHIETFSDASFDINGLNTDSIDGF